MFLLSAAISTFPSNSYVTFFKEFPMLTTFFEGEIIGEKHSFLTRKWDASEEVDRKHWSRFPAFQKFTKNFNSEHFQCEDLQKMDYVFMRWKVLM